MSVEVDMNKEKVVEITEKGGVAVVTFRSASICNVEEIVTARGQVKAFIKTRHPMRVVFDFGTVKFFSSQVLGLLLDIRDKMQKYNGELVISSINPQLHRVFKITNLETVFAFFPDKESAVKAKNIS